MTTSDRDAAAAPRWVRSWILPAVAGLILLGSMVAWSVRMERIFAGPPPDPGETVILSLHRVDGIVDDDTYRLRKGGEEVVVEGPTADLWVGRTLTVEGHWESEPEVFVEEWRQPHDARTAKVVLGLVGTGFLVVVAPLWFRIRDGRVVERG